jgi:transposase-like protein
MGSQMGYRRRRSRDEWRALLAEQQDSGLTQSAFCRQRGLAISTFQHWKRKLATAEASDFAGSSAGSGLAPAFTEITLPPSERADETAPAEVELELGPGVRVTIRWASAC